MDEAESNREQAVNRSEVEPEDKKSSNRNDNKAVEVEYGAVGPQEDGRRYSQTEEEKEEKTDRERDGLSLSSRSSKEDGDASANAEEEDKGDDDAETKVGRRTATK